MTISCAFCCCSVCATQTDRRAAQRPAEDTEYNAASSSSSARRAPRVTKATATMGSPEAVIHTDAASAASHASLRGARGNNKRPNPLLEFDEEGAASLMEAFPLDVSSSVFGAR